MPEPRFLFDSDPGAAALATTRLAESRPAERPCEPAREAGAPTSAAYLPVDVAPTPRMRRFTDIWVAERRRQLSAMEAAS